MKTPRLAKLRLVAASAIAALPLGLSAVSAANAGTIVVDSLPAATFNGEIGIYPPDCPAAFCNQQASTPGVGTDGGVPFVPTGSTAFTVTGPGFGESSTVVVGNNPLSQMVSLGGNSSTITATGVPEPSLSVSTSGSWSPGTAQFTSGDAQTLLQYQFEVVAPGSVNGTVQIGVKAAGSLSMSGTPFPSAFIGGHPSLSQSGEEQFIIGGVLTDTIQADFGTANGVAYNDCIGNPLCTQGAGFISTLTDTSETGGIDEAGIYTVNLNQIYNAELNEYLNCNGAIFSCSVSIDPTITVPAGDTLMLSQGFGNGAPITKVPEPGTLTLLGTGLIGLAMVGRREKRRR